MALVSMGRPCACGGIGRPGSNDGVGLVAKPLSPRVLARGAWVTCWLALGVWSLWNPHGAASLSASVRLPTPQHLDIPLPRAVVTRLSWWPQAESILEVVEKMPKRSGGSEKPVVKMSRVKPVPEVVKEEPVALPSPSVVELPELASVVEGAAGDSLDPRARALAALEEGAEWKQDARLTVVALYVRCPGGPGLCAVDEARVLQSPQPDVRRLLLAYGQGSKINLAQDDRDRLEGLGGGWVIRSFRLASSEELLP